jgi:hypothetical protein
MRRDIIFPGIIAVVMITVFSYISEGYSLIYTFVPAVPVAWLLYYTTCYKSSMSKAGLVPFYLLGLGFQLLHFAEEHTEGFEQKFGPLFGGHAYNHNVFVTFNMVAYFMFLMGAIGFLKDWKILQFFAMFFIVYGMFGNAIGHVVFCIKTGGYFPGIYTSFLNLALTPFIVKKLYDLKEVR